MKKRKFNKYLLTWLLAFLMVVSTVSGSGIPAQAAEASGAEVSTEVSAGVEVAAEDGDDAAADEGSDDSGTDYKFSLTYRADRVLDDYDVTNRYTATFESNYPLFLYWDGIHDYSDSNCRVYLVGMVKGGLAQSISNTYVYLLSGTYTQYKTSTGKVQASKTYTHDDGFKALNYFNTSSESDYVCDCYVFESLADAEAFFENGEEDTTIRPPDEITEEEPVDETWKGVILGVVSEWLGGILETLVPPLKAIAEGISQNCQTLVDVRDHIIDNLPKRMSNALRGFFNTLDGSIVDSGNKILAFHNWQIEKFEEFVGFFDELLTWTESVAIDIGTEVTDAMFALMPDWLENLLKDHFNMFFAEPFDKFLEFLPKYSEFMQKGFDNVAKLTEDFSKGITKFFEFVDWFLDGVFMSDFADKFWETNREVWQPVEDAFFEACVPDFELVDAKMAELRSKLGFIDDFMEAGEYLLNFVKNLGTGKPPVFTVSLWASKYMPAQTVTIDLSWYAQFKPAVDLLVAGVIWVNFLLNMYKRLPEIINGVGAVTMTATKIDPAFHVSTKSPELSEYTPDVSVRGSYGDLNHMERAGDEWERSFAKWFR